MSRTVFIILFLSLGVFSNEKKKKYSCNRPIKISIDIKELEQEAKDNNMLKGRGKHSYVIRAYVKQELKPYLTFGEVKKEGKQEYFKISFIPKKGYKFVAIKIIEINRYDKLKRKHVLQETRILKKVSDKSKDITPKLYYCGHLEEDKDVMLLFLEYGKTSLKNYIKSKKRLPIEKKLSLSLQMASLVKNLHKLGVIHCDLKIDNFLIVNGILKLIDFGTSQFNKRCRMSAYYIIPPEKSNKELYIENDVYEYRKYDVYSLGISFTRIFFEQNKKIKKLNTRMAKSREGDYIKRNRDLLNYIQDLLRQFKYTAETFKSRKAMIQAETNLFIYKYIFEILKGMLHYSPQERMNIKEVIRYLESVFKLETFIFDSKIKSVEEFWDLLILNAKQDHITQDKQRKTYKK